MKKRSLLKTMLLLCALIVGSGSAWGQAYSTAYTLSFSQLNSGSNYNNYGNEHTVEVGNIQWGVYGNQSLGNYVRIGGKGGSKAADESTYDRTVTGKGSIGKAISKITVNHNGISNSNVTVNSVKLTVASNSTFTENVSEVTVSSPTVAVGTSNSFDFFPTSPATEWTKDYYYKFTFNIKVKGSSNYGLDVVSIVFYETSSDPSSNVTFDEKTPSINYPATKTFSQTPTTATGYTGAITYSITANTAGASINSSTGVVTVTKGGSVTVKAQAAAVTGFTGSEDTYTLTVNDTRGSAGLAWSASSVNVQYGADNNIFPTLTNTHDVTVTYTSSNQAAATIDENSGVITLKDYTGKTTISAIFDGNDDYLAQTVTYELNVTKAPFAIKDGVFDFVEAAKQNPLEDYGSGMTLSSDYTTASKTWTAGNVTMVTSKVSGSGYRWWSADGTLRFYNKSKATFSVPNGYVITKIVTTGASFDEANIGTLSGSTWTGASKEVALSATATRNIATITVTYCKTAVTITSAGWASFSSGVALDFTETGVTAYIAKANDKNNNTVTLTEITKVPANTGIVVSGSATTHNIPVLSGDADATTGNLLKPWLTAGEPTETTDYYTLAVSGGNPIFKKSSGGMLAAGKSYLVMPTTSAPQLSVDFGEGTTNLEAIRTQTEEAREGIFDLSGRRVENPTKGLYIVNGKKVVIK